MRYGFTAFLMLFVAHSVTSAQLTTVQLPTVQNFSMSTTVSVPDRGTTYMGGIKHSYQSSNRRRVPLTPFSSRSFSRGQSSSQASVSAFIHNFDEMDRDIRQQANQGTSTASRAASLVQIRNDEHQLPRVSDIRRRMAAKKATQYAKAAKQIRTAVRFENAGKYSAARAEYRNAYSDSKPDWQAKIRQRLQKLDTLIAQRSEKPTRKL